MSPCAHRGHGTSELTQLSSKISQPEVAPCPRHIFEYLRLEGFGGGPGHLGAEAEKEFELEWGCFGEVDWLEIENMSFHSGYHAVGCGTGAGRGYSVEAA